MHDIGVRDKHYPEWIQILRWIQTSIGKNSTSLFTETADEYQFGECLKPGFQEDSTNLATMIDGRSLPQFEESVQQTHCGTDRECHSLADP